MMIIKWNQCDLNINKSTWGRERYEGSKTIATG